MLKATRGQTFLALIYSVRPGRPLPPPHSRLGSLIFLLSVCLCPFSPIISQTQSDLQSARQKAKLQFHQNVP